MMRLAGILLLSVLLLGCVREYDRKPAYATTTISINRQRGQTTLTWNSELGKRYAVVYRDSKKAGERWKPYAGAEELRGTGREMRLVDESPGAFYRSYMVHALVPLTAKQLKTAQQNAATQPQAGR